RMHEEQLQQLELARCELNGVTPARDLAGLAVEHEVLEREHAVGGLAAPPQHGPHACHELFEGGGLGDIGVGAGVETRPATAARAVSMMIPTSPARRRRRAISSPSSPGSITSSTTTSGWPPRAARSASSPVVAVDTANPSYSKPICKNSRICSSSSTISTLGRRAASLAPRIVACIALALLV